MANSFLRGHPSAMTADQYYDAEAKRGPKTQTEEALGFSSVPFFERPLDADESDRIVGEDEAGNFIRQTISGNRYLVSLNPDQRTARTKIEEDVIPAVKEFARNPRFPTGKEVGDASRAIVKEVIDTASIPGDLFTGKRSPTDVQMGDAFELAGGTNLIGAKEVLPDNAMGIGLGVFRRKTKPYTTSSTSLNTDIEDVGTMKKETITFARPISEYVKSSLKFTGKNNKDGDATILGSAFLKDIQTNLNITEQSFPKSFLDLQKKYTKEELIELVEEKEFKNKAVQNDSTLRGYQPQSSAGYVNGVERENFIFPIESTTGTGKKFSPKGTHFGLGDTMIAHVRGQIIDPKPVTDSSAFIPPLIKGTLNSDDRPTAFTDAINNEPYLLSTEFQTDLLQKGYDKPSVDPVQKALKVFAGYNLPYGMSSKEIFKDENLPTLEKILREGKSSGIFPTDLLRLKKQNFDQKQMIDGDIIAYRAGFSSAAEALKTDKDRGYIDERRFDFLTSSLDSDFKTSYLDEDSIKAAVQTAVDNGLNIAAYEKTFTVPEISASASIEVDKSFLNNTTPASQVYNQGDSESLTVSLFREESKKLQKAVTRIAEEDSPEQRSAIAIVDIFENTTIGEFSSMTQDWLNFGEENRKKVLNFQVNADDIGGRTQGELGDPGTISMFAENLARKKLGLSLVEEGLGQEFRGRFDGYPDDINGYFRLVNAYSNMVFESLYTNKGLFKVVTDPKVTEKFVKETTADILKIRKEQILEDDKIQNFFDGYATETLSASDLKVAYQKTTDTFNSALNQENVVNPPVKKDISKQITDEMFKVLLIKAATSGVTKIVIPNTTRMAMADRFSVREKMPKSFTKIMDDFLPKTVSEFAKNYEGVNVQEVDLPYQDSNNSSLGSTASGYIAKAREEGREVSKTGTVIDISEFLKKYKVDPDGSVRQFAEGGLTMNQQTQMAFALGGEAETRDPVSGNDVPPGSLPVEVRDDIPARLSEGEYVVPADVVRFFGVKFFEDIRMEAKKGLQQMDVDGRIGGEPIPPQMQMAQAPEQDIDAMIDAEMGNMNAGGLMSGYAEGAAVTAPSYTPGGGFGYGYGSQPMSAPQTMAPPAPVAPVITATAEPVARQEPVGGCPEGTLWNGYLCAVNLSYNPNAGDLPDDPETTPVEKWYEEDNGKALVNPEEYITENFNKGSASSDINSLIPKGPGAQLAFGIFDLVNKKSSISKAAAAYRLAEARDQIIEGSDLAKIGDQLFGKGDFLGRGLVGSLSDGDWKLNSYARELGFKNWEDSQSEGTVEGKSVQTTSRGKTTTAPMFTGITKKAAWKSLDKYLSFKIGDGSRKGQAYNIDPAELAELRDTIIYTDEDRGGSTGAGAVGNIISGRAKNREGDGNTISSTGYDFANPLSQSRKGAPAAPAITREVTPISSSERARLSGNTSNSSNTSNNVGTTFSSRGKNKNKGGLITKRKKK